MKKIDPTSVGSVLMVSLIMSHSSLVWRQKGLTTSHSHTQLDPFASKLMDCTCLDKGTVTA